MKILFLVPYPLGEAPSQRFRFEQYFERLSAAGYSYRVHSFFSAKEWKVLYSKGNTTGKIFSVFSGFIRRLSSLAAASGSDIIFIHREVTPVGPPVFEWIIAKVMGKKIIYDFDDAIWLTDKNEGILSRIVRWRSKVKSIIRWSHKVSCGNHYLSDFARQFNTNVVFNPTTIDTSYHLPRKKESNEIVIGWTGSHSTLKYLDEIVPVIQHLERKYQGDRVYPGGGVRPSLVFVVIANKMPGLPVRSLRYIPWNRETEIEDLSNIDIGIMPLPNDDWSKGKCGFKLLQYMAIGIPSIASPVGANMEIISNGVEGFICAGSQQWIEALERLIEDPALRIQMGKAGRTKVGKRYSVDSNTATFLSLFEPSAINTNAIR
jgi:glycosyltransferase involved in cell wall biosynthesis